MTANAHGQDVSELLRSLTAYIPNQQQQQQQQQSQHQSQQQYTNYAGPPPSWHGQQQSPDLARLLSNAAGQQAHEHIARQEIPIPPPRLDPTTITEWPLALRYVTKLTAQHEEVVHHIRRLIRNQQDNERQWWQGRLALQDQQTARVDGKKQLDGVLKALGVVATNEVGQSPADELAQYNGKVYAAQKQMVGAMESELRMLGIPFFGTDAKLVVEDEGTAAAPKADQKPITTSELRQLQRKMLVFLEDLCRE